MMTILVMIVSLSLPLSLSLSLSLTLWLTLSSMTVRMMQEDGNVAWGPKSADITGSFNRRCSSTWIFLKIWELSQNYFHSVLETRAQYLNNCSLSNYKGSEALSTQQWARCGRIKWNLSGDARVLLCAHRIHLENLYLIRSVVSFDMNFKSGFNTCNM